MALDRLVLELLDETVLGIAPLEETSEKHEDENDDQRKNLHGDFDGDICRSDTEAGAGRVEVGDGGVEQTHQEDWAG